MSNPKTNYKTLNYLANRIKSARQERGLSQKELGDALKLSDKAVSSYEVGRAEPTITTLKDISKVTMKPLAYFLDETPPTELELKHKLAKVEQELLEIKQLLKDKT
jgi:transcriptional regulator with XRE-family HTH domain